MATVLLTPFVENSTPQDAHQALKLAVTTMAKSRHCAVLWFADIKTRKLYRKLGYSSMYQYAEVELGFSSTRTGNFLRLAGKLEELPQLKKELERGDIGYTKGLEVAKVANSQNEKQWLEEARNTNRKNLARKVLVARNTAARDGKNPEQGRLLTTPQADLPIAAVKHCLTLEMTTDELARFEALWEKLHKLGGVPGGQGKVDIVLAGMEKLVGTAGSSSRSNSGPSAQIIVHKCPDCENATITTRNGEVPLAKSELKRLECDARVVEPGQPNRATIAPSIRREVLIRDRHQCQGKGCCNTYFLEVHHLVPRNSGGSNKLGNLITLCSACHRVLHERHELGLDDCICPPAGEYSKNIGLDHNASAFNLLE